ncbi:hypothetical protein NCCP28_42700 [Niallia sp. NCCP-28]|nr:hypothetical protein NCCP28_42700 [Niallia sp. NCCP-28]
MPKQWIGLGDILVVLFEHLAVLALVFAVLVSLAAGLGINADFLSAQAAELAGVVGFLAAAGHMPFAHLAAAFAIAVILEDRKFECFAAAAVLVGPLAVPAALLGLLAAFAAGLMLLALLPVVLAAGLMPAGPLVGLAVQIE